MITADPRDKAATSYKPCVRDSIVSIIYKELWQFNNEETLVFNKQKI